MSLFRRLLPAAVLIGSFLPAPFALASEKYIVPVFGVQVRGFDGVYSSTLSLTNPSLQPIAARITDVLPLSTGACEECRDLPDLTVGPQRTVVISDQAAPRIAVGSSDLLLGAFVLEADRPLFVESEIFRAPALHASVAEWQVVEIARDWIPGGQVSILPRVIPPEQSFASFNLFLINPSSSPARFEFWTDCGGRGETIVAARATALVSLTNAFLGEVCGPSEAHIPKGFALPLYVRSDFSYQAAVSTRSLILPPLVHVAHPAP